MLRCESCGSYHNDECDPERVAKYRNEKTIKQAQSDLTSLEAEFSEYLQTKHGRFDLYYLDHQTSRGKETSRGSMPR